MSTLDSARTGAPDGTNGIKIATFLAKEDTTIEVPAGIALTDVLANGPTAHRSSVPADSATDMSSAGFGASGLKDTNNRGAIALWVNTESAGATAVVRVIYYDAAATPAPMTVGPLLSFTATSRRLAAAGNYLAPVQLVETYGFAKFKVFVESITAGDVDVFAEPI